MGIVGSVVVALGVALWVVFAKWQKAQADHIAEIKACHTSTLDLTLKNIEASNRQADALAALERVVDTAIDAMRSTAR